MPRSGRKRSASTVSEASSVVVVGSSVAASPKRCRESVAAGADGVSRRAHPDAHTAARTTRTAESRFIDGCGQNSIPPMATVVLDIETAGVAWDSLDDAQKTYLQKNARTDEERERLPETM